MKLAKINCGLLFIVHSNRTVKQLKIATQTIVFNNNTFATLKQWHGTISKCWNSS